MSTIQLLQNRCISSLHCYKLYPLCHRCDMILAVAMFSQLWWLFAILIHEWSILSEFCPGKTHARILVHLVANPWILLIPFRLKPSRKWFIAEIRCRISANNGCCDLRALHLANGHLSRLTGSDWRCLLCIFLSNKLRLVEFISFSSNWRIQLVDFTLSWARCQPQTRSQTCLLPGLSELTWIPNHRHRRHNWSVQTLQGPG